MGLEGSHTGGSHTGGLRPPSSPPNPAPFAYRETGQANKPKINNTMKKHSTTQYQLNQLVDFIAKYFNTFDEWKDQTRYAVFARRKRWYALPTNNFHRLVITHDYDKPDFGSLEYLGSFHLFEEDRKALEDFYGQPLQQIFSTFTFYNILFGRFEGDRVERLLRYLAIMAGRKEFTILLTAVGNADNKSLEFAPNHSFDEAISVPVHHIDKSRDYKIDNGKIVVVTADTYPDYVPHYKVDDITDDDIAPLAISSFMFDNSEYVLLDVNAVLQNQRLLEKYRPQIALHLLHEFSHLLIIHEEYRQRETERINRELRRIFGDELDQLGLRYRMDMKDCPFTKAMIWAFDIHDNSKEYDDILFRYFRIPSDYFVAACQVQHRFEKAAPRESVPMFDSTGVYVVA